MRCNRQGESILNNQVSQISSEDQTCFSLCLTSLGLVSPKEDMSLDRAGHLEATLQHCKTSNFSLSYKCQNTATYQVKGKTPFTPDP